MKIKFYLLWFENEPEWANSKIDYLKEVIEENGFEWVQPTICKKESEFDGNFDAFDIILMDFRLVNGRKSGKTGGDIIEKIREKDCFTNIMFYSQEGEAVLRREIADKELDGVFCVDRGDFVSRFEQIFMVNIKKIEDVNNVRGLVMAETADLEEMKEEIIRIYDKSDCPKKAKIKKTIIDDLIKNAKNTHDDCESLNENISLKEMLHMLDFYKKSLIVHRINKARSSPGIFIHDDFYKEIIVKRNLLAHVKERKDTSGKVYLESEKFKNQSLKFTRDEAKKIRKDISKYRKAFQKIIESFG